MDTPFFNICTFIYPTCSIHKNLFTLDKGEQGANSQHYRQKYSSNLFCLIKKHIPYFQVLHFRLQMLSLKKLTNVVPGHCKSLWDLQNQQRPNNFMTAMQTLQLRMMPNYLVLKVSSLRKRTAILHQARPELR